MPLVISILQIKEAAERRRELRRLAREKAENQTTEAIPCVTIGCSADSEEAAGEVEFSHPFSAQSLCHLLVRLACMRSRNT